MNRPVLPKWCHAFSACNNTDVALVGNGPLSAEQREHLNSGAFQVVIRLNFLNNRCVPRVDEQMRPYPLISLAVACSHSSCQQSPSKCLNMRE